MREILFRGKRKDTGEWVEGYYYKSKYYRTDNELCDYITIPHTEEKYRGSDSYIVLSDTVGQYTGLLDKNGKKIFEGDIVDFDIRGEDESYGVVEYSNEETEFYLSYDNLTLGLGRCNYSRELEVIGNIHDNHELLEQEG